jgi:hypothetical protein
MSKVFQVDTGGTLTTSLISYYKLDDATDFFGSNNLTNNGSVTFVAGHVGNAASFNATNFLNIVSASGLPSGAGAWSINLWLNHNSSESGDRPTVFFGAVGGSGQIGIYRLGTSGDLYLTDPPGTDVDSTKTVSNNTWHMLTATFDGTTIRTYVDNVAGATTAPTPNISGTKIEIGRDGTNMMTGLIDEVGIWSKKLSTTEITDLWNSGNGQTMITAVFPDAWHPRIEIPIDLYRKTEITAY